MNKNFKENRQEVAIGQKCWYWRVAGAGILKKAKWRGPARVVTIEKNDEGRPIVMWLVHGTSLIRCSPRQVPPLVKDTGYAKVADPQAALDDLKDLRARNTTQFKDVTEEPELEDQAELMLFPEALPRTSPWTWICPDTVQIHRPTSKMRRRREEGDGARSRCSQSVVPADESGTTSSR